MPSRSIDFNGLPMSVVDDIEKITHPVIESRGAFLVDIRLRGQGGDRALELFIDTDGGVTTDLCAEISREVSHEIDKHDIIGGRYYLVVSSPGLDRPLKFPRQYPKNISRTLTVKYGIGDDVEVIRGELIGVGDRGITLKLTNDDVRDITFDSIREARVNPAW